MKIKSKVFIVLAFILVGAFFIVLGIIIGNSQKKFMETAVSTEAVITKITEHRSGGEKKYRPYITYSVDGVTYSDVRLGYYKRGMDEGDVIEIYYDPENPEDFIAGHASNLMPAILCIVGGVCILFGIAGIFLKSKNIIIQQ